MLTHPQLKRCLVAAIALGIAGAAGSGSQVFASHAGSIGGPSAANGWSTTSAVSISNGGGTRADRALVNIINGSGINIHAATPDAHGMLHTDGLFPLVMQTTANCCATMGFNTTGAHSAHAGGSNLVSAAAGHQWNQFKFDQPYSIDEMLIWNYGENQFNYSDAPVLGGKADCSVDPTCGDSAWNWSRQGMKEVHINHSMTGSTTNAADWTQIAGPGTDGSWIIPKGNSTDSPVELPDISIPFNGATAQYVVISTVHGNNMWTGSVPADSTEFGAPFGDSTEESALSEVRFVIPEPGTIAMLAISGVMFLRRRR